MVFSYIYCVLYYVYISFWLNELHLSNMYGLKKQQSKKWNAAQYTAMLSYYYYNKHWGK